MKKALKDWTMGEALYMCRRRLDCEGCPMNQWKEAVCWVEEYLARMDLDKEAEDEKGT